MPVDSRPGITATEAPCKPGSAANEPALIGADLHAITANQHYLQPTNLIACALLHIIFATQSWDQTHVDYGADQLDHRLRHNDGRQHWYASRHCKGKWQHDQ